MDDNEKYWDSVSEVYNDLTKISTDDFHYGPLIPGDKALELLPKDLKDVRALEIGCGAAQNSIYLAKCGAVCTAFDISSNQIKHAISLRDSENVEIDLITTSMDTPDRINGLFDLIHSVYAVSFSKNPLEVIEFAAKHLTENGAFIFSTGHPLAQYEWLELDSEIGLFMKNYYNMLPDVRYDDNGEEEVRSNFYTISEISDWIYKSDLVIERILEPKVELDKIDDAPYYSESWNDTRDMFAAVPVVAIFVCRKRSVL
jgi:SAM-dependent methyltransferase